ncbi:exonuclease V [Thermothelomyces heterothallicus CBS 202.75]|uniref:exonuclease V n=1 Tax=Thermothelomyces heterothallicus CBS 202.75 TaxID=1149848 RepID=UPI003741F21E
MAGFVSDSGSEYGYDLTASDEERLFAIADRLSGLSPQLRPAPAGPAPQVNHASTTPARNAIASGQSAPELDPNTSFAIEETIAAITDDDLSFDISELQDDVDAGRGQGSVHVQGRRRRSRDSTPESSHWKLAPSVSDGHGHLASFISGTKPRSMPTLLPDPEVRYPDLSRALSEVQDAPPLEQAEDEESVEDNRSPLLRFRTFPMKPFSVSDLAASSWCELQYFYTLTRLPGGKKTRTTAMKRGTKVHEKLERELFQPVEVEITKKEDNFGLKIWNMIQGLRVLRDQGYTREFEVWGMVEGNLVCGVIDSLAYENPDEELQDEVISSRGSSQTMTNSQPYELSTPGDHQIFITDVKTRNSVTPPPQSQVRVSLIQLFLYHRFMSDMASDRLDYMRVFARFGLNPDEPFSDSFMAQIGAIHDEVFAEEESDVESASTLGHHTGTIDGGDDRGSNSDFVSASSNPSQHSSAEPTAQPTLKYRTLSTLLPLLKRELALTFPRGASTLGKIVAVEYRYRGRDSVPRNQAVIPTTATATADPDGLDQDETDPFPPDADADAAADAETSRQQQQQQQQQEDQDQQQQRHRRQQQVPEPERGSVICTHTFFVEPETLDLFLAETMRWWKGERPPRGVPLEEASFKCRSCEFVDDCEWRRDLDREARRRAAKRRSEREAAARAVGEVGPGGGKEEVKAEMASGIDAGLDGGDVEDGGGAAVTGREERRRGRPRRTERKKVEDEDTQGMRGGGRPARLSAA